MIGPYQMVAINLIFSLLILSGALFYKFIYPKKNLNLFVLLLVISIPPIISIFRAGAYESGDFDIHVRRSMEFFQSLNEGVLIPSWAANLNATYGYPVFSFDYILPYYVISFFHFLSFSFITSLKLFLAINFILSGVFMYLFSKNHFKNTFAAFATSVFYLFAPYHLIALHFKITIGEILAYTLIPLVFYFISKFLDNKKSIHLLLGGLLLGLTILSHIAVGIFLLPVIFIFIYNATNRMIKTLLNMLLIIFIALLVAAFQWSAPLIYASYLFTTYHPLGLNSLYFPSLTDLLYAPWRLGFLFQGPKGELSFLIGYAQILIVAAIIIQLLKNKIGQYKKTLVIWLLIFAGYIFFITPYSKIIWQNLPLLKDVGSQRLLIIMAFIASMLAGYFFLLNYKRKYLLYLLIIFAIGSTILNWGNRRTIPTINDATLRNNLSLGYEWGDTHFYALPKWVNPNQQWFTKIPSQHLKTLQGKAIIKEISRTSTLHTYEIRATMQVRLQENTLYFPGWTATFNNSAVALRPDSNGVITLNLPKGKGTLKINYADLRLFQLTKALSIVSIVLILLYALIYCLRERLFRPKP